MMKEYESSSSLGSCHRRFKSSESPSGNGNQTFKKTRSLPAVRHRNSSTFNIQAEKWMLPFTLINAALRFQCTLELKSEGSTTQEVDENPLNERESLMQQQSPHNTQQGSHLTNERTSDNAEATSPSNSTLAVDENSLNERESLMQQQSPHNTQQGLHLTNERTSDNAEATSPSNSTLALDEDGLGARLLSRQQHSPQNTRRISALMYKWTYEASDHTSPSDYGVTIHENEPDVIQPLRLQQSLQNVRQIIGFHRLSDATPFEYMPAAIFAVFFLLALLYLFRVIR